MPNSHNLPTKGPISKTASIIISIINVTESPHHLLAHCCYRASVFFFLFFLTNSPSLTRYAKSPSTNHPPSHRKITWELLTTAEEEATGMRSSRQPKGNFNTHLHQGSQRCCSRFYIKATGILEEITIRSPASRLATSKGQFSRE